MVDPVGACGETLDDQLVGCASMCAVAVKATVGKLVVEDLWAERMVVVVVMLLVEMVGVGWVELGQFEHGEMPSVMSWAREDIIDISCLC